MFFEIFKHSLLITSFVFTMMVVIEYLNIFSRGKWEKALMNRRWGQWIFTSFLGTTPGCLGSFAVVSLYMHRIITFGALTGTMVATCGDEAFVMLAMFPKQAIIIFLILFILGIFTGMITDFVFKRHFTGINKHLKEYTSSHDDKPDCVPFYHGQIKEQWKNCSPQRGWLTLFLSLFMLGIVSGQFQEKHSHDAADKHELVQQPAEVQLVNSTNTATDIGEKYSAHVDKEEGNWNWIRITLLLTSLIGLFIVISVPDHFLEEHLWNHIARVHIWRIFLWTFGALLLVNILMEYTDFNKIISDNHIPLLVTACVIGIIPESGPHLIFVTLFAQGAIPFSVLLASSISQDGHGMLPLLSHSRKAFLGVKLINLAVAFAVGILGYMMGW